MFVRAGDQHLFLLVKDIVAVRADGNYTHVLVEDGRSFMVRDRICDWRNRLPGESFHMLGRFLLVRLSSVRSWQQQGRGADLFVEGIEEPLFLGRTAFANLRAKLKQ